MLHVPHEVDPQILWLWQRGREGSRPLPSPQTRALCRAAVAPAEFCIHVPASPEPVRAEGPSLPGERMVIRVFISSSSGFVAIKKKQQNVVRFLEAAR